MFRVRPMLTLLLALGMACARPASAQMPVEDWTARPDSWAPAGVVDDAIPGQWKVDVNLRSRITRYDGLLVGTEEYDPILVLMGQHVWWDMAPLSMTVQSHDLDLRVGLLDWLGVSARLPLRHTSTEFVTNSNSGTASAVGIGDVEAHLLYGLHDVWPYRAHISAGVAFPTGSVTEIDAMPNNPHQERTLPYPMQPGTGVFAILPAASFAAENNRGTVGLQLQARIPVGENDRGWKPGSVFAGSLWMSARFNDWVSGSVRLVYRRTGTMTGFDPAVNAGSSPMAQPELQAGTVVELPIGVNLYFPNGPLSGNRLRAEVIFPGHQDLDGPQMKQKYGLALAWGVEF